MTQAARLGACRNSSAFLCIQIVINSYTSQLTKTVTNLRSLLPVISASILQLTQLWLAQWAGRAGRAYIVAQSLSANNTIASLLLKQGNCLGRARARASSDGSEGRPSVLCFDNTLKKTRCCCQLKFRLAAQQI